MKSTDEMNQEKSASERKQPARAGAGNRATSALGLLFGAAATVPN